MRDEWRTYWGHFSRYKQYVVWGFLLSLVPFAFNYIEANDPGSFLPLLAVSLGMSFAISMMIGIFVGGYFAILTLIRIRTGLSIKRIPFVEFSLIGLGVVSGIVLGRTTIGLLRHQPIDIPALVPTIILSAPVAIGFVLHMAYRNAKEEALAMRTVMAEARYNLLEHQMRPHFLFNTLNSVAELIESRHERASEVTQSIAEIYRLILANSRAKTVPLESELEVVRRYLELEKIRFGARLEYSISVNPEVGDVYVPSLVLQTLVENGVKHGIARIVGSGSISVAITRVEKHLCLAQVENPKEDELVIETGGTGLSNTRSRLDLLYSEKHRFEIVARDRKAISRFFFSGEKID